MQGSLGHYTCVNLLATLCMLPCNTMLQGDGQGSGDSTPKDDAPPLTQQVCCRIGGCA